MEPLAIISAVASLVVVVGGLYYLPRYFRAQDLKAVFDAKDAAATTWQTVANANTARILQLEGSVIKLTAELGEAHGAIRELQGRYDTLAQFAAPEAVARFEAAQVEIATQQGTIIQVLRAIEQGIVNPSGGPGNLAANR